MHVVIVGCGRVGSALALKLGDAGHSVGIIDNKQSAFSRLPEGWTGRAVLGYGFDRDHLVQAGIEEAKALAAVASGDNSNILAARIARETYNVGHVVARIKDPRRASIYQRLGIPTVASVAWTTEQVFTRLVPDAIAPEWMDASGEISMSEQELPVAWAGKRLRPLLNHEKYRLVAVTREGHPRLAGEALIGQEGDRLHMLVQKDGIDDMFEDLEAGPEE